MSDGPSRLAARLSGGAVSANPEHIQGLAKRGETR